MKTADEIREAVIHSIKKVTSRDDVMLENGGLFEDYALDSLDRMSIMIEVEIQLKVDFDDLDPGELNCINDYITCVQKL